MERFLEFRRHVLDELKKYFTNEANDGHHKSYEGAMALSFNYDDYFTVESPEEIGEVVITLDCYVLGPSRHYRWSGKTIDEAVSKARVEFDSWLLEVESY